MPKVAAEETKTISLGEIKVITNTDTLSSGEAKMETIGNTTTITYDVVTFKILDSNNEGRPDNKAWVGIQVKKPANAIKYKLKVNDGDETETDLSNGESFDKYIGFTEQELETATKNATDLVNVLQITWTGDENTTPFTQVIKIVLVPQGITLKDKAGENDLWNNAKWEENIPKVKVTLKAYKDGKEVTIPDGIISSYDLKGSYVLTANQIEGAKNVLMDDGLEFIGLYMDSDLKTPFVENQTFSSDTIIYVAYKTKTDDIPDTGAFTSYLLLAIGSLIAISVLVIAQKYNKIYHV